MCIIMMIYLVFFTGPLGFLTKVQIDNLCYNKTTSERYRRQEPISSINHNQYSNQRSLKHCYEMCFTNADTLAYFEIH